LMTLVGLFANPELTSRLGLLLFNVTFLFLS